MAEVILGVKASGAGAGFITPKAGGGTSSMVANAPAENAAPATGGVFVRKLGGFIRNTENRSRGHYALYLLTDTGAPGELLGYTVDVGIPGNAAFVEADWAWTNRPGNLMPFLVPGQRFHLAWHTTRGDGGPNQPSLPGNPTAQRYYKAAGTGAPPNPFGAPASQSAGRSLGLYAVCDANEQPTVAVVGPTGGVVGSNAPTYQAQFADAHPADRLSNYTIEVRPLGGSTLAYQNTFAATPVEQASGVISRAHGGAPLAANTAYEWRIRAHDALGTPSEWSDWATFATAGVGLVDLGSGLPFGKQESGVVPQFSGRWTHPQGKAMNAARVRILDFATGASILESGIVAKAATNQSPFVVTGAEAGFGTVAAPFNPGSYAYQLIGRDTDGSWAVYGATRPFNVNYPPNTPTDLAPPSGQGTNGRPVLSWAASDGDFDDVPGVDVLGYVEITRPNGTTFMANGGLGVGSMDPLTGRMFYQPTPAEIPNGAIGVYAWRVHLRDVSAGVDSAWSAPSLFNFTPAPVITLTAPTAVSSTSRPTFAFSFTFGPVIAYRIQVYLEGQPRPFFSSGQIPVAPTNAPLTYQMPAGWLTQGQRYQWDATVWSQGGQVGQSDKNLTLLQVQFPPAPDVGEVAPSLSYNRRDFEPTIVLLAWPRSSIAPSRFGGYVVRRRLSTDPNAEAIPVAVVPNVAQTAYEDTKAPPNTGLVYLISQLERQPNGDVRESVPVEIDHYLPITVPTITSLTDGRGFHFPVMWLSSGYGGGFAAPEATVVTWGGEGAPTLVSAPAGYGYDSRDLTFRIRSDARGSMADHFGEIERTAKSRHPLCFTDEMGRLFCRIASFRWKRGSVPGTRDITLGLQQIAYTEAVVVSA